MDGLVDDKVGFKACGGWGNEILKSKIGQGNELRTGSAPQNTKLVRSTKRKSLKISSQKALRSNNKVN